MGSYKQHKYLRAVIYFFEFNTSNNRIVAHYDLSGNGFHLTLNNNVKHMNLSTTLYSAKRSPGFFANATMIIFTSGYRTLLRHPTTV